MKAMTGALRNTPAIMGLGLRVTVLDDESLNRVRRIMRRIQRNGVARTHGGLLKILWRRS